MGIFIGVEEKKCRYGVKIEKISNPCIFKRLTATELFVWNI